VSDLSVPLVDLKSQYARIRAEIDEAIARVLASQRFILGAEVEALEGEIAAYCNSKFAVGCASGSDAILLALMALDVRPGDEVICPAYTFFATAGSVVRLGGVPVFADIDPTTYNVDPSAVLAAATRCRRLKAIMPVHLFGRVAEMEAIERIGQDLGVAVIEDAAQAIGARDGRGMLAGSLGRAACFSFFPTKNLGGYGDGGMITTNDVAVDERLRTLRVHGGAADYHHDEVGLNSRLDALQAAILRVKLPYLESWNDARRRNAALYDELFGEAGAQPSTTPLEDGGLPLRTPQPCASPASHIYHHYVVRVPAALRDGLLEHLAEHNIGTTVYYPVPLHLQKCFEALDYAEGALPHSELAARETLALPVHPDLSEEQIRHVASTTIRYVEKVRERPRSTRASRTA
jgi:dTDP-4-amino-4,6-dideoxygalactose transaminase